MKKNDVSTNSKKNVDNKKIVKNYLILLLIFAGVIGVTIYLCRMYNIYQDSKRQIPVIGDTLVSIKSEELEHYVMETPTTMIYMCTASDSNCREYEKSLKKLVKKNKLQESIIYLNLSVEEKDNFTKNFNEKYKSRYKLNSNYPAMVLFEDGKVNCILQEKNKKRLSMKKTREFIELHQIGENEIYEEEEGE